MLHVSAPFIRLEGRIACAAAAEMIARRYFRALHDGTNGPVLRAIFAQICHDEEGHVAFHVDTLQRLFANWSWWKRAAIRAIWRVLFRASCVVVMWDHRAILREWGFRPLCSGGIAD